MKAAGTQRLKGVSEVIATILIVGISIGLMAYFYSFYTSATDTAKENVEKQGDAIDCTRNANFLITNVSGNDVFIRNNGGANLNSSHFSGYLNSAPVQVTVTSAIIKPGDNITLQLSSSPALGNLVRIMGDCDSGDEFYVK